jgi:hypothetical protein
MDDDQPVASFVEAIHGEMTAGFKKRLEACRQVPIEDAEPTDREDQLLFVVAIFLERAERNADFLERQIDDLEAQITRLPI